MGVSVVRAPSSTPSPVVWCFYFCTILSACVLLSSTLVNNSLTNEQVEKLVAPASETGTHMYGPYVIRY